MYSLNRAQIIGNVTRDPDMRYTPNGQAVCSFGVATNRRWRDKDGNNQEQTEFHNIVCWRKVAEIISQYVKKGNRIYVEGRLQTHSWEGQDGSKRNRTEIVMDNFVFLTPKGAVTSSSVNAPDSDKDIEEFPPADNVPEEKPAPEKKKPAKKEENLPSEAATFAGAATEAKSAKDKSADADGEEINLDDIPF